MTKSERRRGRIGEQLPLPFPTHLLIDASVSRPREWKRIFAEIDIDTTTLPELGVQQNVNDDVVSKTAKQIKAWVVTEDKEFHYEAASGGVYYPNVIFLVKEKETTLGHRPRLQVMEQAMNYAYWQPIDEFQSYSIVCNLDTGQVRIQPPPIPPPELLKILPALSQSRYGLKNADLRRLWSCSNSTAWTKATHLVSEGWLRRGGRTKGRRYFKGPKLEEEFRRFISKGT